MDIRSSLAALNYAANRPATAPKAGPDGDGVLQNAGQSFAQTLLQGETAALAAAGRADPHALVAALTQTELAVETTVVIRDRVVEAYQEILRMPV